MKPPKPLKKPPEPDSSQLKRVDRHFFLKDGQILAQELLGKYLIYDSPKGQVGGIITETEAYLGQLDPAAHSFKGKNKKNWALFEQGGTAYIYFSYGVHYCFNVVANDQGIGEGVLIRSLEPKVGLKIMAENRRGADLLNLTTGPGKLVQALAIDPNLNGSDLIQGPLGIYQVEGLNQVEFGTSPRIGISQAQDRHLRFFVKNNAFLSRKQTHSD